MARAEHDTTYERFAPLLVDYARMDTGDPGRRGMRERLVVGYLPVARHIARRFANRGEPMDDLEQVATIGLLAALERFDPDRGRDFVSFAVPTIMGEVRHHFRDRTWSVRTPREVKDDHLAVGRAVTTLSQDLGRAPTVPELAEHLGLPRDRVGEAMTAGAALRPTSLDATPDTGDEGAALADVLGAEDPEMGRVENSALIQALIRTLPQRERTILALRFVHDKTQREIGEALCISQMHVSRLLIRTLAQLREEVGRQVAADPEHGLAEFVVPELVPG